MATKLRLSRATDGDRGAYAILYGVLVVVLIGVTALVLDLGMLRMDRRTDRAAVDAGALAGSATLGFGGANPIGGCQTAMRYVEATLGLPVGADTCANASPAGFQGDVAALCAAGVARTATQVVGERTILVTWPIPNTSYYLLKPDMERRGQPDTQTISTQDGTDCSRLAVSIRHTRQGVFSAIWPDLGTARVTESRSVALASPDPGNSDLPAPLVVLEKRQCKALDATGGGSGTGGIIVNASAKLPDGSRSPGFIQVDSAATAGSGETGFGGSCTSGGSAPINVPSNKIWALDGIDEKGKLVPGIVGSFAVTTGRPGYSSLTNVSGCPALPAAFEPVTGSTTPSLCRLPTAGVQVGAAPWVIRYNCGGVENFGYTGGCPDPDPPKAPYPTPRNYVDQWRAFATGTIPTTTFTKLPMMDCNSASGPYSDLYVTCPNLKVTGNLTVSGSFIATGNVEVKGPGGCLLLNTIAVAGCDTVPANVATPAPLDGKSAYIGGDFDVSGGFVGRQTFLYLGGRLRMNSARAISWVGPYGSEATTSPPCIPATAATQAPTPSCFEDLTMWSPWAGDSGGGTQNQLTGNAQLKVDGTLFMPAAYFTYNGQADNTQERAQFVARSLNITGGGLLTMTPDPTRSTSLPRSGGRLIR